MKPGDGGNTPRAVILTLLTLLAMTAFGGGLAAGVTVLIVLAAVILAALAVTNASRMLAEVLAIANEG